MPVYPGAVWSGDSPNSDPRRAAVSQVILHHTASTGNVLGIRDMFMVPNSRSVSANFLVAQDGRVFEMMNPDTRRAWTTGSGPGGSMSPDHSAITLECMDETGDPEWGQSVESQEAIAQVLAWASKRYGFPLIRGITVRGHREMPGQSTACPGGMPMDSITARANAILAGVTFETEVTQEELDELASTLTAAIVRDYESQEVSLIYPGGRWQVLNRTQDITAIVSAFAAVYEVTALQLDHKRYSAFKNAYEG